MIIDCHTHAFSEKQISSLIQSMKKNNIDKAISIYWPFETWNNEKIPNIFETYVNLQKYKNLFFEGSIKIVDKNFNKNLSIIEKMIQDKKIISMKLYTGYEYFYPMDKRVFPIYKLCIEYDIPVRFHSGDTWGNEKNALLKYAHPLHLDELAVKFPDLKIIISHLGYPWIRDSALLVYKHENVYSDFSAILEGKTNFKQKEFEIELRHLEEVFTLIDGAERILFGTDFPLYKHEIYIKLIDTLKNNILSKSDVEKIKWKNAKELFKI